MKGSAVSDDDPIYLRKCHCGAVLITTGDFMHHGIKHSESLVVTRAEYKKIMRERKDK